MSKVRSERGAPGRIARLLEVGDHAAARVEARRLVADGAASEEARRDAAAVLVSLEPEPGAAVVGLGGLLLALAVLGWLLTR